MRKYLFLLLFFCSCVVKGYAQHDSILVKGYIKDTVNKEALPFVDVYFDSYYDPNTKPKYKTASDLDGYFQLKIAVSDLSTTDHVLNFRFIGYFIPSIIFNSKNIKSPFVAKGYPDKILLDFKDPAVPPVPLIDQQ